MQSRIIGLDILRVTCVFVIFLFHASIHLNCSFSIFNPFIKMGPIFMCMFFMLSGFSLYYVYSSRTLSDINELLFFYKKRVISILPLYYIVAILYLVVFRGGRETLFQKIMLVPIETLGIQSCFSSLFNVSHNGGTWFVSCILICYLVYPLIQIITKQIEAKNKAVLIIILGFILVYAPFIVRSFNLSNIYSNPFFRMLEFIIGVLLCSLVPQIKDSKMSKVIFSLWMAAICIILLVAIVTFLYIKGFFVGDYMMYSGFTLPVQALLLVSISGCEFPKITNESKILRYLSSMAYAFWLAQFFAYKITDFVLNRIGYNGNVAKIAVSFCFCIILGIIFHELFEKPISKLMLKREAKS